MDTSSFESVRARPSARTLLATGALFAFAFAACGDDGTGPGPGDNNPPTAAITASPTSVPAGDGNQTVVRLDGSASSDPDGDALTFSWNVPGGTFVNGTSASSSVAQVTFPGVAPYTVVLTVSDGRGGSDTETVTITLGEPRNQPPTAAIAADPLAVPQGDDHRTVVTLDGSGSSDPDGDQLTYSWDVPNGTFVENTSATDAIAKVTFPGTAPYTVTLTVDDGNGGTDQAQVTIQLGQAANQPPVADIQANPTSVPAGDNNQTVVTLDGSGSSDPDGDALTFSWDVPGGTFVNGTTATDAIAQVTFPGTAPYTVTLTVDDGNGGTDEAQVTIEVQQAANQPPVARIDANPTSVPAGDNHRTIVTLDGSGSSDPDGDQLTFQWQVPGGNFVGGTTPTDAVVQVTFPGAAPYTVTLTVDDGNGNQDQAQVTITVQ